MPHCRSYRGTRPRLASRVGRCGRRAGGMAGQIERGLPLATARRRSRLGNDGRAYASLAPGCAFSADPTGQGGHTDHAAGAGPSCPPGVGAKQHRSYSWVQRAPAAGDPKAQGRDGKASPPGSRASRRHKPLDAARWSVARSVRSTEEIAGLPTACLPAQRDLVATAPYIGLRVSELLGLTWDDVDFAGDFRARCIAIVRTRLARQRKRAVRAGGRRDSAAARACRRSTTVLCAWARAAPGEN